MNDNFLRYSCQIALPGFSESSQQKLQDAKVLIVGAGGLGCPCAQYLTAAGIGTIGIADFDIISASNLHRQVLYTPAEVGLQKVAVACSKLQLQNPGVLLVPHDVRITSENVMSILQQYDIVVDTTDNFETKYLLNDACVLRGKPLVYGAIYQYEGQVAVWNILNEDGTRSPNYRDIFPKVNASQIPNCAEGGVIPTIAGIIGCMQANEVIKYFINLGEILKGKILIFDALTMQSRIIKTIPVSKTTITTLTLGEAVSRISYDEYKKLTEGNYELIDVRTTEERNNFNIGGYHLPLALLENNTDFFSGNKIYILYCATGARSDIAVNLLTTKYPGKQFFSLESGIQALNVAIH